MDARERDTPRRWIRALVRLLPFDARRQHGDEVEQVFVAQHEEVRRAGTWRRARLWGRTLVGLLRVAPSEHLAAVAADARSAFRAWRSTPLLTLTLIATTGGGIAAVTVAFSLVNGVLLRALPVPDPSTVLRLQESHAQSPGSSNFTYATFLDLEPGTPSLLRVAAARWSFSNLSGDGAPERLRGASVSGAFFPALGIRAQAGRLLNVNDDGPGRDRVAVLSDGLWRRRFGADPGVIGRVVRLDGAPYQVVGVVPPGAGFPLEADIWKPLNARAGSLAGNRRSHLLQVIARARPGFDPRTLKAELEGRAAAIVQADPGADPGMGLVAVPLLDPIVAPVRRPLVAVLAGAVLLLLVLCGNVGHLLLARASAREREFAVRAILGAGRRQLARLLVTEGLLLSLASGLTGAALASAAIRALPSLLPPDLPRSGNVRFDLPTFALAAAIAVFTGLLTAVAPVLRASGVSLSSTWRTRSTGGRRVWGFRPGDLLGASQLVLAFVLLVGAILLLESAKEVRRLPLGFDPGNLLRVDLSLNRGRLPADAPGDDYVAVFDPILRRLEALPGVERAGLVNTAPLGDGAATTFEIVGRRDPDAREPLADIRVVDPGLLPALRVPLLAGRHFTRRDGAAAAPVMLVSQALARQYFPGEDPIGRSITMKDWGPPLTGQVVGVVGDVVGGDLEGTRPPTIYWPYPQFPQIGFAATLFVRTAGDPATFAGEVKRAIWALEPDQPLARVEPMAVTVRQSQARRLALTAVLSGFAALAVAFALLGVYAILAHRAGLRAPAYAVHMAFGARPVQVAGVVLREALAIGTAGVAAGAAAAVMAAGWLANLLYGVPPRDPAAFVAAGLLIVAVVLAAALVPAWRAASVDPISALRAE